MAIFRQLSNLGENLGAIFSWTTGRINRRYMANPAKPLPIKRNVDGSRTGDTAGDASAFEVAKPLLLMSTVELEPNPKL
jgi:hypothetical protein